MKRIKVLLYWLFNARNNVTLPEIIKLTFFRRSARARAWNYIDKIEAKEQFYEITFRDHPYKLYWPIECGNENISMVACETFDEDDWHYYQKENTRVGQGEILLDVGAAEGLFSLSVLDRCAKIIMIEPNRFFSNALLKTFQHDLNKVEILNVAAGNEEGTIDFSLDSFNSRVAYGKTKNQVKLTRIDDLGIEKITYLKADVEGFELEMLKGAEKTIRRDKPKIAITAYHVENDAAEIIRTLIRYVPEYKYYYKGVGHFKGKPVMIHFWI
jgi:FkbM family methyltransferase